MIIDGPNNVTIKPSSSEKENGFLQLTCSASCYHECRVYRWYMVNNLRSEIRSSHILTFYRLSKTDSGKYQCKVTDDFGTKSEYYTVDVQCKSWLKMILPFYKYTCNKCKQSLIIFINVFIAIFILIRIHIINISATLFFNDLLLDY